MYIKHQIQCIYSYTFGRQKPFNGEGHILYVHIHIHTYTYIYMYTHTHIHKDTCVCECVCTTHTLGRATSLSTVRGTCLIGLQRRQGGSRQRTDVVCQCLSLSTRWRSACQEGKESETERKREDCLQRVCARE